MKNITKFLIFIFIISVILVPVTSFALTDEEAKDALVPCGTKTKTYKKGDVITPAVTKNVGVTGNGGNTNPTQTITPAVIATGDITLVTNPCKFNDVMTLVNRIINFVLFGLALPIVAIMIAYAGVLYLFSGVSDQKSKAKEILSNAVIGLVIAFCAYIIIHLILKTLGYSGSWIGFS